MVEEAERKPLFFGILEMRPWGTYFVRVRKICLKVQLLEGFGSFLSGTHAAIVALSPPLETHTITHAMMHSTAEVFSVDRTIAIKIPKYVEHTSHRGLRYHRMRQL